MANDLPPSERALLEGTFLFSAAPAALTAALDDPRCTKQRAEHGQVLYGPNDFPQALAVLLAGRVEIRKGDWVVRSLAPGELFGAAALFGGGPEYPATLTALGPCTLLLLPQRLVEDLMAQFPAVGRNYVGYLSDRIRFLNGKLEGLLAPSAPCKLARYLMGHLRDDHLTLDCSTTALANRLNISRASLYRALDDLTAGGLIRRTGRDIWVQDREGLSRIEKG